MELDAISTHNLRSAFSKPSEVRTVYLRDLHILPSRTPEKLKDLTGTSGVCATTSSRTQSMNAACKSGWPNRLWMNGDNHLLKDPLSAQKADEGIEGRQEWIHTRVI